MPKKPRATSRKKAYIPRNVEKKKGNPFDNCMPSRA